MKNNYNSLDEEGIAALRAAHNAVAQAHAIGMDIDESDKDAPIGVSKNVNIYVDKGIDYSFNQERVEADLAIFNKLDTNKINLLESFSTIKKKTFFKRKRIMIKHRLFKQGIFRNIGLIIII